MYKYIGHLLVATGVLHNVVGIIGFWKPLSAIHRDRYFNTVRMDAERNAAFWFLITGALLMALGQQARATQQRTGAVPASLGWSLLAISVPGVVLIPVSGFWLVLAQGFLVLAGARRAAARRKAVGCDSAGEAGASVAV